MRILILGYIVRCPLGGIAWHHLQYVIGFHQLGHDVYFLEDSGDTEWACYDPSRGVTTRDSTYGLRFIADTFERAGLNEHWAYYDANRGEWSGPCSGRIREICETADVVFNVSRANPLRPWFEAIPERVLIDTDPVFTQIRLLTIPEERQMAEKHTSFFSFGQNFGLPGCDIPDDGFPWRPTRQPVTLSQWPIYPPRPDAPLTTVMQWDSYPTREYIGRLYGMKSLSFGEYFDLPRRTAETIQLAMGTANAPRQKLRESGWELSDPLTATRDPWTFQDYIGSSKAEFAIAKHGFVVSNSGWFSERSAAYLACGRPLVAQDTGFGTWLPESMAILPFRSLVEAIDALGSLNAGYTRRCREARELVEQCFSHEYVLGKLLEEVFSRSALPEPRA